MKPLFSLLLPTRKRSEEAQRLLTSIVETTEKVDEVEVVLYMDEDDEESQKIKAESIALKRIVQPRGYTMGQITRTCFEASSGQIIMLLNDDVVFKTYGWDKKIFNVFQKYDDRIALVYWNDLFQKERMASFPFLSREACHLLGKICPSEFKRILIDVHIFDIFKKLEKRGFPRIVYLSDVVFEHLSYDAGKADYDANYASRDVEYDQMVLIMGEDRRQTVAAKIEEHICNFRGSREEVSEEKRRGRV